MSIRVSQWMPVSGVSMPVNNDDNHHDNYYSIDDDNYYSIDDDNS